MLCTVINRPEGAESAFEDVLKTLEGLFGSIKSRKLAEHVVEHQFSSELTEDGRKTLFELADALKIDIVLQPEEHQRKKLVVFDMDSTLIQNECIDLIAARANVEKQVSEITERAMRGELDFSQSLSERVKLLKGISTTVYGDLLEEISLTPGARELCQGLKANGVKLAVLSGGFQPIVDWIKGELNLDYAFANNLSHSEDGKVLTGTTYGKIVDGNRKAELLREIAAKESIELSDVSAVGDGSNDLPMMAAAGFGIAWHAKPLVQQKAPSRLNSPSLKDVLYLLGYSN